MNKKQNEIYEQAQYLEHISKEIIKSLKIAIEEKSKDNYIYTSEARARFKRLRIELTKELVKIEKEIY